MKFNEESENKLTNTSDSVLQETDNKTATNETLE